MHRHGLRTENERLKEVLKQNCVIDSARADVKMLHYPDWKETDKSKWVEKGDLKSTFNSSCSWNTIPVRQV